MREKDEVAGGVNPANGPAPPVVFVIVEKLRSGVAPPPSVKGSSKLSSDGGETLFVNCGVAGFGRALARLPLLPLLSILVNPPMSLAGDVEVDGGDTLGAARLESLDAWVVGRYPCCAVDVDALALVLPKGW